MTDRQQAAVKFLRAADNTSSSVEDTFHTAVTTSNIYLFLAQNTPEIIWRTRWGAYSAPQAPVEFME